MSDSSDLSLSQQVDECPAFKDVFESWLKELNSYLQQLLAAAGDPKGPILRNLVHKVVAHYQKYYEAKSLSAKHNVEAMFHPSWATILEGAFLWVGGWRPSMAFHLLYSKSGLQFQAHLSDILRNVKFNDLGDLSSAQLTRVDELHRSTIKEEREISEKQAEKQERMADASMVELAHAATKEALAGERRVMGTGELVESALRPKRDGLEELLVAADDLRMRTLRGIVEILSPVQAAHFLIAAAELHLRLHEWGRDREEANTAGGPHP